MSDAIVVGAGVAGLMGARELIRVGKTVVLLEASGRVGGRVHTLHDARAGVPVELGAEFVHGEAPLTTRLLDEARLVTVPVLGNHYRSDHGQLSPLGPAWTRMARVFAYLNPARKNDRSFQEFLDEKPGGARLSEERVLAQAFIQGFEGADTNRISEKSLAQGGDPTEGALNARRIVRGYAALVEHLRREIGERIRLHTTVERVMWNEAGARVLDATGAEHLAQTVLITVPLPMLQHDVIRFEPEVPALRRAASTLVMGHVMRLNVVVKERFWEKKLDDVGYVHAPNRPFTVWWTQNPLRAPLLVGWSGGPPAVELGRAGNVEDTAIAELARAFGIRRSRMESLVEAIHRHDWTHDAHTRGAYSYVGVGGSSAPRSLARPIGGTLFIAGEASDEESGGTVESALASGARAARQILKRLAS
jgi:monoamine oxidase